MTETEYDRLLLPENLTYAWLKAKRLYRGADGFIDNGEVAEFELNLEQRLAAIQRQFERGRYRLSKLRPVPRPKKLKEDTPVDRQYYHASVADQVAWIAIANVLGPQLDQKSPPWNYGNRIYRPAWYDDDEEKKSILEIGPYRHASGHLYRKFQHSWPLFRRHVALTAKTMVGARSLGDDKLDTSDILALATAKKERLQYLQSDFWSRPDGQTSTDIFYASIDLKQFYPSIKKEAVIEGLKQAGAVTDDRMEDLLLDMLEFRNDLSHTPKALILNVEPKYNRRQTLGLPTGLFVSGFLANAAMFPVDFAVDKMLREQKSLAHFRFVDDHTFLAYDFDDLCNWIDRYQSLLVAHGTGATVNSEKYDPESLSKWMRVRAKESKTKQHSEKKAAAIRDTKIDGAIPTKLLTKTLAQVSAIAATNVDILDDDDLQERLRQLEWLLLADIPDREIRPDTRAAFAAAQISILAPRLVQEADGLIDASRELASIVANHLNSGLPPSEEEVYRSRYAAAKKRVDALYESHKKVEQAHLRRCFELLLQAFREFPGKARLFYRLHEYCRVTGFNGLAEIASWIDEERRRGHGAWADYYAGLSLQILARSILHVARTLRHESALRSDIQAAIDHIEDVASLSVETFLIPESREAWFHKIARQEIGVALLVAAEVMKSADGTSSLHSRLIYLAGKFVTLSFDHSHGHWVEVSGRSPGVWAHLAESILSTDEMPSPAWSQFQSLLSLNSESDFCAARRYPEKISDEHWIALLESETPLPETDSGWLREAMEGHEERMAAAKSSRRLAFARAARSLEEPPQEWMTLVTWTKQISNICSPFDPRRSEWTALEIARQISLQIKELGDSQISQSTLERLHPSNVLIPTSWRECSEFQLGMTKLSWEEWRKFLRADKRIKLRETSGSVVDYRYFDNQPTRDRDAERRLVGIGRLLLGILGLDHSSPRIWNIRGNERTLAIPRMRSFNSLAISSPTLLIIDGCLGRRSAETRTLGRDPELFGWFEGVAANDAAFDPPLLRDVDELLSAIRNAQIVLENYQVAVALNQPRQLIPFRLADFAAGPIEQEEDDDIGQ